MVSYASLLTPTGEAGGNLPLNPHPTPSRSRLRRQRMTTWVALHSTRHHTLWLVRHARSVGQHGLSKARRRTHPQ
jgi:hypothetical protein